MTNLAEPILTQSAAAHSERSFNYVREDTQ